MDFPRSVSRVSNGNMFTFLEGMHFADHIHKTQSKGVITTFNYVYMRSCFLLCALRMCCKDLEILNTRPRRSNGMVWVCINQLVLLTDAKCDLIGVVKIWKSSTVW